MWSQVKEKKIVVITDLDGTLLDQRTYSYEPSLPAVARLRELKISLVLCSSKTAAEIIPLQRELGLKDPFICESGGAVYFSPRDFKFSLAGMKTKKLFHVI